jgi:bacillolysin
VSRRARLLSCLASLSLAVGVLAATGPSGTAVPAAGDGQSSAASRLKGDATGKVTLKRNDAGEVTFVGTAAGTEIDNPSVSRHSSVAAAARAHLNRYGAALGATRPGTTLVQRSALPTSVGTDVVRFTQRVGGIPVVGGDVVLTLAPDRELVSMLATTSRATHVTSAEVSKDKAATVARARVARNADGPVDVAEQGRWLLDPDVAGTTHGQGPRTVWRFDVSSGQAVRRQILVDDQTGGVLMDINEIQELNRVVCDRNNVRIASPPSCTSGFVRTESSGATGIADAESAFQLAGATSDFYSAIGGPDLTTLLGIDIGGGVKALASTTRFCYNTGSCPYANAFWNGTQMYYGDGYAGADDVVGHEITHGVTDRYSQLFYWGQSGAINESMSDIMGEIVDHRHVAGSDTPTDWQIGEDLPDGGAIRDLANPPAFNNPDRTGSSLWNKDISGSCFYCDSGGVHYNSGVGNKTAYLISQGGSFNGQTITGIDGADPNLTKTAKLYLLVIQSLSSGSDYADLANVLDQSCNTLVGVAGSGFTATNCTEVHEAGLATQLAITPTNAAQPADAPDTCPGGTSKKVLFDSETGTPASKFTSTAANWLRTEDPYWGSNAHSGIDSWNNATPIDSAAMTAQSESLVMAAPIAVPSGQPTYLHFHEWHSFEFLINTSTNAVIQWNDGGTVEIDNVGDANPPQDAAGLTWVNGPNHAITSASNPANGRMAFTADGLGWLASRVDLSSFGGQSIKPQFSVNYNSSWTYLGWWLDDIQVYTCGTPIVNNTAPTISGTPKLGQTLTASNGTWTGSGLSYTYQWFRAGTSIPGATAQTYQAAVDDVGSTLTVAVTASNGLAADSTHSSAPTSTVAPGDLTPGTPTVTGTAQVGQTLTANPGTWAPSGVNFAYQWRRDGVDIGGATFSSYTPTPDDLGKQISVRVAGSKPGYTNASPTSGATSAVVPGDLTGGTPTISGTTRVGKTLTGNAGAWGPAPVGLSLQWLRNGAAIAGATRSTYKLKNADKGKRISLQVTGTRSGYTTLSKTSAETKKIKKKKKKKH